MDETIFPAALALRALRSTSYKNTAYAVAELVDNSFDAEAKQIGVALLVEEAKGQPHTVAVLDNGAGMDFGTLKRSVQYGFSRRHGGTETAAEKSHTRQRKPLGKFGVGLVAASFSQCSDLTVMSWQNGEAAGGKVPATRIRLAEEMDNILPDPSFQPLPDWASRAFIGMPDNISDMKSGSLVIWRKVEPSWKRANTLSNNLISLCGRIYRNFVGTGRLSVSVGMFDLSKNEAEIPHIVPAVDPTFLTNWDDADLKDYGFVDEKTLFDPYTGSVGDSGRNQTGVYEPERFDVKQGGRVIGACLLTASYRSERVLSGRLQERHDDPGDAPYGRLANRLQGVSILRSEREIDLDPSWLRLSRSVDRWVSVSLDFDPDLDDVFGVSNDKQKAYRLAETASLPLYEIKTRIKALEEGGIGDAHLLSCLQVAQKIKERLNEMQKIVRAQRVGSRSRGQGDEHSNDPSKARIAELVATGTRLSEGGTPLPQDDTAPKDHPHETAAAYGESTSDGGLAKDVRTPVVIEQDLKVDVVTAPYEMSSAIFRASLSPGHMVVHLNQRHSLYSVLSKLVLADDDRGPDEPEPTVEEALQAIRSILISYSRAQAEAPDHQRNEFERCALAWGEVAERVFKDMDE